MNPFTQCIALSDITVDPTHPTMTVVDGVLINSKEHRIVVYPMTLPRMSYTVPDGITAIGSYAFAYSHLRHVYLPETVTRICDSAFAFCSCLTDADLPQSLQILEGGAFRYCINLDVMVIPNGVT